MRPGISIALLLVLLFQTVFLLPLTRLSLELHQEEVEEYLSSEEGKKELIQLSFSVKEIREKLEWVEENEFIHQGWMYDVVDSERKGEKILLTVYKDRKETRMRERNEALNRASQSKEKEQGRHHGSVQPFKYFKSDIQDLFFPSEYRSLGRKHSFRVPEEVVLGVPVPPPCI